MIRVIIADDDPDACDLIFSQLDGDRFKLTMKESCEKVLETIKKRPDKYDVVLLDNYIPGHMSGLECLKKIKAEKSLQDIPVILQTAEKDSDNVIDALNEGAFYFLEKTTKRKIIRSVVLSAMETRIKYQNFEKQREKLQNGLKFIEEAHFKIKTLEDMESLTALLSTAYPDPESVTIGIHELLTNAIEHGNLGITYDGKSKLILKGLWKSEIDNRLAMEEYRDKTVEVHFHKKPDAISLTIKDQGRGFDSKDYLNFDIERLFDAHGRGIAVAKHMSFDHLEYNEIGNQVSAIIYLNKDETS